MDWIRRSKDFEKVRIFKEKRLIMNLFMSIMKEKVFSVLSFCSLILAIIIFRYERVRLLRYLFHYDLLLLRRLPLFLLCFSMISSLIYYLCLINKKKIIIAYLVLGSVVWLFIVLMILLLNIYI